MKITEEIYTDPESISYRNLPLNKVGTVRASMSKDRSDTKLVYDMEFGLNLFVLQILSDKGILQKKTHDMRTEFVFPEGLSSKEKEILERFFGGMANKTGLVFENTIA
ncbi:hypothetical protein AAA799P11_00323 [Marine Group I thaumarchaeote SCGC AAA799-P11]|uniref:Uncharacterized protein n=2 Tax=Marine Group I TaxID=905826 RepID=A0A087S2R4_9ARCH|nr:hypothetical protein AAA799N04_00405 [Marine Group I thaumarchaeote SCGC AAA799-N04]KFM20018.1 hypothetical protein AAA799P11_00323 [Marine Group I thaumarchaeote SCGC AAA799-P11]